MATLTWESTQVYFLPVVANLAAPTPAEMSAGADLTAFTPVAGIQIQSDQERSSLRFFGQAFTEERMANWATSATLTFTRHTAIADDDAWTFFSYLQTGYLVIVLDAAAATRRAEVYPVECGQKRMHPSAENELKQFSLDVAVVGQPELNALLPVVAGPGLTFVSPTLITRLATVIAPTVAAGLTTVSPAVVTRLATVVAFSQIIQQLRPAVITRTATVLAPSVTAGGAGDIYTDTYEEIY